MPMLMSMSLLHSLASYPRSAAMYQHFTLLRLQLIQCHSTLGVSMPMCCVAALIPTLQQVTVDRSMDIITIDNRV